MDCVGRLVERLDVDPHHATMVHPPRQAHQRAIVRLLASVDDESVAERRIERDLQLVDDRRSLGESYEVDPLYGSPPDHSKGLVEYAILIGTDVGRPVSNKGRL